MRETLGKISAASSCSPSRTSAASLSAFSNPGNGRLLPESPGSWNRAAAMRAGVALPRATPDSGHRNAVPAASPLLGGLRRPHTGRPSHASVLANGAASPRRRPDAPTARRRRVKRVELNRWPQPQPSDGTGLPGLMALRQWGLLAWESSAGYLVDLQRRYVPSSFLLTARSSFFALRRIRSLTALGASSAGRGVPRSR